MTLFKERCLPWHQIGILNLFVKIPPVDARGPFVGEGRVFYLEAYYKTPEDLFGENGLLKQLIKKLVDRVEDEMSHYLGHTKMRLS